MAKELNVGAGLDGGLGAAAPAAAQDEASALIADLGLEPHPEGGWYRELHRSGEPVRRRDGGERAGLTVILFLLVEGNVSRWHRVRGADETWHHAGGSPLELWRLPPAGGVAEPASLGPLRPAPIQPLPRPAFPQSQPTALEPVLVVPAGWWQAARPLGAWSLVSCCVGPGFDFVDFELLRHQPPEQHPAGALAWLL